MNLPNFLGLGAQRAGSSWLDKQLRSHPDIYLPEKCKEVHFFDRYYNRGVDWYRNFFIHAHNSYKYTGEITPMYLYDASVPKKIYDLIPDCKFLVILRNPVNRAYSQYCRFIQRNGNKYTFHEYLTEKEDAVQRGFYYIQIMRYLDFFPIDNFLFLIFEETMKNPGEALEKIAAFLAIDVNGFDVHLSTRKVNASYKVRFPGIQKMISQMIKFFEHNNLYWIMKFARSLGLKRVGKKYIDFPKLLPDVRIELMKVYEADINSLEKLLKRDFSIWRK